MYVLEMFGDQLGLGDKEWLKFILKKLLITSQPMYTRFKCDE